jgi:hypothetical protein
MKIGTKKLLAKDNFSSDGGIAWHNKGRMSLGL